MNLLKKLSHLPKRFAVVAAVVVAGTATALSFAWGPGRTTFTIEKPASYVTFNSITNNPIDGDERNFARSVQSENPAIGDVANVQAGKEYTIRMVVHNNAADNLKLEATGTKAMASVPQTIGKEVTVSSFVYANNAQPNLVWDDVTFKSDKDFSLVYVPGSARIYNSGYAAGGQGQPLPDSLVTSAGAMLGYAKAGDGIIPGCFKYLSYVEYKVKPQFAPAPNFTVSKQVRPHSTTSGGWLESYTAKPGDTVDFVIRFANTGQTTLKDVTIKDVLPKGMTYVAGSTVLANGNFPSGKTVSDNVTGVGINIGTYMPGITAWVRFSAKIATNDKLAVCGLNTLKNIATAETDNGNKSDDALVVVTKDCPKPPVEKTIEVCRLSDKKYPVTIKESEFDSTKYSKNPNDCKTVTPPTEIPSTGPAEMLGGLFGSSALAYGAYTYASSRRALKNVR